RNQRAIKVAEMPVIARLRQGMIELAALEVSSAKGSGGLRVAIMAKFALAPLVYHFNEGGVAAAGEIEKGASSPYSSPIKSKGI
ncbi:MAG: hypothetical protein V9E94_04160, partial [Microthrixaceae bacterium]